MFEDNESPKSITVLGKTFSSEEERRNYFREELRKKLPELKKMEGFPIGEDEDIINLSDPPYYTACPNPWLNDFIAEWEKEKKELEKQGKRKADFEVIEPYATDVSEGKNHPIYSAHTYFTKVPHAAIMRYILHYTEPGDVIFDGFSGTGMAGVAASFCYNPNLPESINIRKTSEMRNFGKRNSICSDISAFATFVSSNYNKKLNLISIQHEYEELKEALIKEYPNIYKFSNNNKNFGETEYVVWSQVFSCPVCYNELVFFNDCYDKNIGKVKGVFNCAKCNHNLTKKDLNAVEESQFDPILNKVIKVNKYVPALVSYKSTNGRFDYVLSKSEQISFQDNLSNFDFKNLKQYSYPMMHKGGKYWADIYRSGYHKGITHSHHFFTNRNYYIFHYLWHNAKSNELKWVLSSIINYH